MMGSVALFGLAVAIAAPAATKDVPTTVPSPAEKKTCRNEAPTGSLMTKRTCHTAAEWREIDDHYHTNVENLNDQRTLRTMTPRGG